MTYLRKLPFRRLLALLLVLVIGVAILIGMVLITRDTNQGFEVRLPLLVIIGVVALLLSLTLMSVVFTVMGLSDRNEALGLPEGTVRAVIALSLIVIFVIASIYLYSSLSTPSGTNVWGLTKAQVDAIPGDRLLNKWKDDLLPGDDPSSVTRYVVQISTPASQAGNDFAKQMLTLLGVLVTAITSFYFGTRANEQASSRPKTNPPKLLGVSPITLSAGATGTITLQGSNLLNVVEVSLNQPSTRRSFQAKQVLSNDSSITATFDLPADATGKFDVVVRTDTEDTTRLENAIEVGQATGSG